MNYGLYLSAAGLSSAQTRQDAIANNLANVETVGFKRTMTLLGERRPGEADDRLGLMTGGLWVLPTRTDLTQGALENTGNTLDIALVGDGFLGVQAPDGHRLTRDGRLTVRSDGLLASATDPRVILLDAQNRPLSVGEVEPANLHIDEAGVIRDRITDEVLATLRLVDAATEQIRPVGGTLFQLTSGTVAQLPPARELRLEAGFVERSNADPTVELTRLIEVSRLLEANANMLRHQDTALGRLIEASSIG